MYVPIPDKKKTLAEGGFGFDDFRLSQKSNLRTINKKPKFVICNMLYIVSTVYIPDGQ